MCWLTLTTFKFVYIFVIHFSFNIRLVLLLRYTKKALQDFSPTSHWNSFFYEQPHVKSAFLQPLHCAPVFYYITNDITQQRFLLSVHKRRLSLLTRFTEMQSFAQVKNKSCDITEHTLFVPSTR